MTDLGTKPTKTEIAPGDAPWIRHGRSVIDDGAGPFPQESTTEESERISCDAFEPDTETLELIKSLPPFSLEINCGKAVTFNSEDCREVTEQLLLSEPRCEFVEGENLKAFEGGRHFECQNYETCLSLAAALDWQSFTCHGCNGRINPKLLWRAHQRLKVEPGLSAYCSLPALK